MNQDGAQRPPQFNERPRKLEKKNKNKKRVGRGNKKTKFWMLQCRGSRGTGSGARDGVSRGPGQGCPGKGSPGQGSAAGSWAGRSKAERPRKGATTHNNHTQEHTATHNNNPQQPTTTHKNTQINTQNNTTTTQQKNNNTTSKTTKTNKQTNHVIQLDMNFRRL